MSAGATTRTDRLRSATISDSHNRALGAAARLRPPRVNPALRTAVIRVRARRRLARLGLPAGPRWPRSVSCGRRVGDSTRRGASAALIGDGHLAHWRAAVDVVAHARGWRAVSMTSRGASRRGVSGSGADAGELSSPQRGALRWLRSTEHHTGHVTLPARLGTSGLASGGAALDGIASTDPRHPRGACRRRCAASAAPSPSSSAARHTRRRDHPDTSAQAARSTRARHLVDLTRSAMPALLRSSAAPPLSRRQRRTAVSTRWPSARTRGFRPARAGTTTWCGRRPARAAAARRSAGRSPPRTRWGSACRCGRRPADRRRASRRADRTPQAVELLLGELAGRAQGLQARLPQRLVGQEVADAGEHRLVHDPRLERPAPRPTRARNSARPTRRRRGRAARGPARGRARPRRRLSRRTSRPPSANARVKRSQTGLRPTRWGRRRSSSSITIRPAIPRCSPSSGPAPPSVSNHIVLPLRCAAVSVRPTSAAAISPAACGRQT